MVLLNCYVVAIFIHKFGCQIIDMRYNFSFICSFIVHPILIFYLCMHSLLLKVCKTSLNSYIDRKEKKTYTYLVLIA